MNLINYVLIVTKIIRGAKKYEKEIIIFGKSNCIYSYIL
jgi:hypothetical protein